MVGGALGAPSANTYEGKEGTPRPDLHLLVSFYCQRLAPWCQGPLTVLTSQGCAIWMIWMINIFCQEDSWFDMPQTDPERIPRRQPGEQPDDKGTVKKDVEKKKEG